MSDGCNVAKPDAIIVGTTLGAGLTLGALITTIATGVQAHQKTGGVGAPIAGAIVTALGIAGVASSAAYLNSKWTKDVPGKSVPGTFAPGTFNPAHNPGNSDGTGTFVPHATGFNPGGTFVPPTPRNPVGPAYNPDASTGTGTIPYDPSKNKKPVWLGGSNGGTGKCPAPAALVSSVTFSSLTTLVLLILLIHQGMELHKNPRDMSAQLIVAVIALLFVLGIVGTACEGAYLSGAWTKQSVSSS